MHKELINFVATTGAVVACQSQLYSKRQSFNIEFSG